MDRMVKPTKEDGRIAENRGKMGVFLLRKQGSKGLSSGSIVGMTESKLLNAKSQVKWCLLTSNPFPPGEIRLNDYFIEYFSTDLKSVKTYPLSDFAQSTVCYQPTAGLVLIPVKDKCGHSILDERRTFQTEYCNKSECDESHKSCFIVGSRCNCKILGTDSLTVEEFILVTKKSKEGELEYELQDVHDPKTVFRTHGDIVADERSYLCPYGAVILKGKGPQTTCIGVLNFSDDKKISPVFFTQASLTGESQLYYPTIGSSEGRTEVDASLVDSVNKSTEAVSEVSSSSALVRGYENQRQMLSFTAQSTLSQNLATEPDNPDEGSPNDDHTIYSGDYTFQEWQKRDQETIALLKKRNAELQKDIIRTEQQNGALYAEMEKLLTANIQLREEGQTKRIEWNAKIDKLSKGWDTEIEEHEKLRKVLHAEREKWRAKKIELHTEIEELRAANEELRAAKEVWHAANEELRAANEELSAKLKVVPDQLKELLRPKDSAVAVLGEDTSNSESTKDVKAEGPSGSSANNKQADSDGSCKEEPFLDPLSKVASKLD